MKRLNTAVAALVLAFAQVPAQAANLYSNLFVLGDSLSDTGNAIIATGGVVELPPYTNLSAGNPLIPDRAYAFGGGRFSNGPVWVEYLAQQLGVTATASLLPGGTGFAFGGAVTGPPIVNGIPTLSTQSAMLFGTFGPVLPSDALYVVFGGGNDIRAALEVAQGGDPVGAAQIVTAGVTNIASIIQGLAIAGARNFLVPDLPNLGRIPAVIAAGPAAQFGANQLTLAFNGGLATALAGLEASLPIEIVSPSIYALLEAVANNPGAFGFSSVTGMCARENAGTGCSDPASFLFWDGIHPTTAGHQLIGETAFAALIPIPAALPLLASAIVLVALRDRRAA